MTNNTQDLLPKKRSLWLRLVFWLLILILLFILLLPLLIHVAPIQNWLVDKAANRLSEKAGAEISIDEVDFSIYDGLILKDLFISDPSDKHDTLAFVGSFSSSLDENILSLVSNKLALKDITVSQVQLNISTLEDAELSNLDMLLSLISSGSQETSTKGKPLDLRLAKVNFDDVSIKVDDRQRSSKLHLAVSEGFLHIEKIDLKDKQFWLKEMMLSEPRYTYLKNGQSVAESGADELIETQTDTSALDLRVDYIEISNGRVYRDDWYRAPKELENSLDVDHLHIIGINLNADSTSFSFPFELRSEIKSLTLVEESGFEINQFDVGNLVVTEEQLQLTDFILETGKSKLGSQLSFEYTSFSDFKKFAQNIEIDSRLKDSRLSFRDMFYFFPDLAQSSFAKQNRNKWIKLTGDISGTIDDLDAENLYLSFYDLVDMQGSLGTFDLTNSSSALINLHVEKFNTSLSNLQQIIPGFTPPEQFFKLDPIRFTGDIDGFFKDFVIFGTLDSPLGRVRLDTRLDVKAGIDDARYSGEVSLENFDMKSWTENSDFGYATFSAGINEGRGLTLKNLRTDLIAELESFDFKGYSYSDIKLEGLFEQNLFNGKFSSADENAKLDFDGQINIVDKKIESDFKTKIEQIDLIALNLSKDISAINGNIDLALVGSSNTDFVGSAIVEDLALTYQGKEFRFDSLLISSSPAINGSRNVIVSSEILNATIDGRFDFANLPAAFQDHMHYAHPAWARKLKIKKPTEAIKDQHFGYKLQINDTKDYLELAKIENLRLTDVKLSGIVDVDEHKYKSNIRVDKVEYNNLVMDELLVQLDESKKSSDHMLTLTKLSSGNTEFKPIEVHTKVDGDNLSIRFMTKELMDSFQRVDLTIHTYPKGDDIIGSIADNTLQMFSSSWEVHPANKIIYGDKKIELEKFVISDGHRKIYIDDIEKRGIGLTWENFDFLTINGFIDYDKIKFAGEGALSVKKLDLFQPSSLMVDLAIDTLTLNEVSYGSLEVHAVDDGTGKIEGDILLARKKDDMYLDVDAKVDKKSKSIDGTIAANNLPMSTFEFIIDDGISNTAGQADVFNGTITGSLDDIRLKADAQVTGGTTTIDYLGAQLNLGTEQFLVTDKVIELTGATIADKYGNIAEMTGGLNHDLFTDFTTELTMESDYFLALDTDKFDNPSYYGQGIGDLLVEFSGPFSSTDITVAAVTGRGTVLNIPVGDSYDDLDESFIQLVSRDEMLGETKDTIVAEIAKLEGVDIRMNLAITEEAKVNIIFDENTNDIIKGVGNGNMRVVVSRQGDFNIFGDYVIERGDYLFTYFNGFVSKPFSVKKGGQITWTGDPINANINLEANYEKLRAPMSVFLAEYLTSPLSQTAARQRTDIDLSMFLTGTLYEPEVSFDLDFPEIQGEIKSLAESKMRILRDNEAELNEQVAGLIMFGSFLPSSSLGGAVGSVSGLASAGYNTLSEMISNQLSHILSGFLQEALTENGFVSGIDFELGFTKDSEFADINSPNPNPTSSNAFIPDEIEVHLKPRFQNDRWDIDYGTSYVNNNISSNENYFIHDFVIGFFLTDDRRLRLKAYGKWDRDVSNNNGLKSGFGINYKKEFGSLTDFKKALSDDIAKLKRESN